VPQVTDLAETGQITPETLFYDATTEQWVAIGANAELKALIFPEKKKLSLKAKEIKTLIGASDGHVRRGVELVNKAGLSLGEIVGGVKRVAHIVSEIAAASREQSAGVQEVEGTVSSMEVVTQKNASLVEETTASLNAVDKQVEVLLKVIGFFHGGDGERVADDGNPAPLRRHNAA